MDHENIKQQNEKHITILKEVVIIVIREKVLKKTMLIKQKGMGNNLKIEKFERKFT